MIFTRGEFNPAVDETLCVNCGICLSICPGIYIDPFYYKSKLPLVDVLAGSYLRCYTAHCKDPTIRKNSTSGGLITAVIVELIKNKEFDSAFILNFTAFNNQPVRLNSTSDVNTIIGAAKSKYLPSSVFNIVKALMEENSKRHIITALPCQVLGIKKFMQDFGIPDNRLLILGLFCDLNLNFNFIEFLEKRYAKKNERLGAIDYRNKEKSGWPGDMKLEFSSGRAVHIDRTKRMQAKKYFQLKRCLCCVDKLNRLADIAFGDCYIQGEEDPKGKSSVIIRSVKGKEAFDKCSHLLKKIPVTIDAIIKSQNIHSKNRNVEFLKVCSKLIGSSEKVEFSQDAADQFRKACQYIKWGRDANYHKIAFSLMWTPLVQKIKGYLPILISILGIFDAVIRDFIDFLLQSFQNTRLSGENIIIIGADTLNKGAEAMLFTVVDEMKNRFPSKRIYDFSTNDFYSEHRGPDNHAFDVMPWETATKIKVLNYWGGLLIKKGRLGGKEQKIKKVLKNAFCIIDINGYHLHSHWGEMSAFDFLLNIIVARRYRIPFFIFPQSMGPFDFKFKYKIILFPLIWLYLKYPLKIFVREKTGLALVKRFVRKNIKHSRDIVLQKKFYNLDNIFRKVPRFRGVAVKKNAVGIVFNTHVFKRADHEDLYLLYQNAVASLIAKNKYIYMIVHSTEDSVLLERLFKIYQEDKRFEFLNTNYNAIEIENIIKQFDFMITSRYHSIIHAYKHGVPVIVLGWAEKYIELLKDFEQTEYLFNIHKKFSHKNFLSSLDQMLNQYELEKEKIRSKFLSLKKADVFGEVGQVLKNNG